MKIKSATSSGASVEVDLEPDAKLEEFRSALCVHQHYKPDSFELFLNEKILDRKYDHCDLKSLNVSEDSLVMIVRKQVRPAVNMCFLNKEGDKTLMCLVSQ